jgi:hypothetical protein
MFPCCAFPGRCWSFFRLECWICLDQCALTHQFLQSLGISATQFLFEMREFVCKLPIGNWDVDPSASRRNFRGVELVAAFFGFVGNAPKIACYSDEWIAALAKSIELRVMSVALGCPEQNLLRE